ncbi:MAG: ELWxxDGT repeat protein, partial [Bacteroidia bacterium]
TSSNPSGIYATSTMLYLSASDATNGCEVWTSDGTTAGTVLLKDINTGAASGATLATTFLSDASGTIYFAATDGVAGLELWKTNGSAAGTMLAADINAGSGSSSPANMITSANILYFSANNSTTGTEPYKFGAVGAGVNEVYTDNGSLLIYPNPSSSTIHVMMSGNTAYDLSVFSAVGELIISKQKLSGLQEIDLSSQASGMYMVIVNSQNGSLVKKIVKN